MTVSQVSRMAKKLLACTAVCISSSLESVMCCLQEQQEEIYSMLRTCYLQQD